jgi:membrane-associated phospholipid phosphatase
MDIILYWNAVALEANRISHTVPGGEQTGPTLSSRALAIVHLAIHDAYFGVKAGLYEPYCPLPSGSPNPGTNAEAAVSAAASTTLCALYPSQRLLFEQAFNGADIPTAGAAQSGRFGRAVGDHIIDRLAIKAGEPGAGDRGYSASFAYGRHREDPDNPGQGFHAPFYGATAARIAVSKNHELDEPPYPDTNPTAYERALVEVIEKGGAPTLRSTERTPEETLVGTYWAYDGASMLGTPPRLYNQMIRKIVMERKDPPESNARLFALVNAAMGDAGILAWREKYRHDLWRPVLGVREHVRSLGPTADPGKIIAVPCDPFWLPFGAPRTNEAKKSFTPPFPAYPSGHATFGAAAFQMVRLHFGETGQTPDGVAFDFVSDELNGSSIDMNGTVRTRHERHFNSLWEAIFENAVSRVYLGVHWHFDAFDASDVLEPSGNYKDPADISYTKQVGGVKLGLDIANDIFDQGLICANVPPLDAPVAVSKAAVSVAPTNYSKF